MEALFPEQRESLLNTRRIAEMCDLQLPLGQLRIPHFPVPDGETPESWLRAECERGLAWRYGEPTAALKERLDSELGVITSMGYAGYFLMWPTSSPSPGSRGSRRPAGAPRRVRS
jgi:DNA polymerase-3 subunit alpha